MQGFKDHTEGTAHTSFFFFVCVCLEGICRIQRVFAIGVKRQRSTLHG